MKNNINSKIKVLIIQRIFSNYRKPIFDKLNEIYDLKILHSVNNDGIKQVRTEYSEQIPSIKYYKKETSVYLAVFKRILAIKPNVIIHEFNPSILDIYFIIVLKKCLGYSLILWGHGFNKDRPININQFSIRLRIWLARRADAIIVYGQEGKNNLSKYVNQEKIFIAYNTLDTEYYSIILKKLNEIGKEVIKKELSVHHQYNIVFIGRLLKDKILPEIFIEIVYKITSQIKDVAFHIIGEGESESFLKEKLTVLDNVFFYGAVYDEMLIGKYLFISDLALNPGYLGLSIIHAFSFGTPVFSFEKCKTGPYHSPEIEYLINNMNGYLAKDFNIQDLSNKIIAFLQDAEMQSIFKNNALNYAYTVATTENMLSGLNNAIEYTIHR